MKQPTQVRKDTNTRALLEVVRDNALGPIWQDKGITLEWVAEIVLTQAGFTEAEMAALLGRKIPTPVQRSLRVTNKGKAWTKIEDDTIVKMWAQGNTAARIAKALKRTNGSVGIRIHALRTKRGDKVLPLRRPEVRSRFSNK